MLAKAIRELGMPVMLRVSGDFLQLLESGHSSKWHGK